MNVSGQLFVDRGYRCAVQVLLGVIGTAIGKSLLHLHHLQCHRGA